MLKVGGVNETERRIAELKVVSLHSDVFVPAFEAALKDITAGEFLNDEEKNLRLC
jgi:hypothetical protein